MYDDDDEEDIKQALAKRNAWVTPAELNALNLERATGFGATDGKPESPTDQALRMLREAAPMAAASLVKLAQHSDSDTVRLRASVEILQRAQNAGTSDDGRDPWAKVYEGAFKDVRDYVASNKEQFKDLLNDDGLPKLPPT